MTNWSGSYYGDVQGRLRAILIAVAAQLHPSTIELVDEMIDANECGVALEIVSQILVESEATLSEGTFSQIKAAAEHMAMDTVDVDRLRSHVE